MNLDFDFYTLFMAGLQSADAFVATFGIIAAAAIAVSLVSKIGTWVLPQPSESRVADFCRLTACCQTVRPCVAATGRMSAYSRLKGWI